MTGFIIALIQGVSVGVEFNFPEEDDPTGYVIFDLLILRFVWMWGLSESDFQPKRK